MVTCDQDDFIFDVCKVIVGDMNSGHDRSFLALHLELLVENPKPYGPWQAFEMTLLIWLSQAFGVAVGLGQRVLADGAEISGDISVFRAIVLDVV